MLQLHLLGVALTTPRAARTTLAASDWKAAFAPQPSEFTDLPLRLVAGSPPAGLSGTFFKNGPANFARGATSYAHWLDGDGYVTALRVAPGEPARWSGRYVRTDAYDAEAAAGDTPVETVNLGQIAGA